MDAGFIKLHRKITDWEWFDKSEMVHIFIFLIAKANYKDNVWRGVTIKRGQLVTSLDSIKAGTKLSIQTIRTCLTRLEKSGEINKQTTNKFTVLTICKYDDYNDVKVDEKRKSTNKQQTTNKQSTTTKEGKERKEGKEGKNIHSVLDVRKQKFAHALTPFVEIFGKDTVKEFYEYWTEPTKSGTKFRQELERTWDTKRRLETWVKNDFSKKEKKSPSTEKPSKFETNANAFAKAYHNQ